MLYSAKHCRVPNLSRHRRSPELISFGNAIRALRQARGMSQEALALEAEVDLSYLGRIERGDNNPALLTLCRISMALGTSASEILRSAEL